MYSLFYFDTCLCGSSCRLIGNQTPVMSFMELMAPLAPYCLTSAKQRTFVLLVLGRTTLHCLGIRNLIPIQKRYDSIFQIVFFCTGFILCLHYDKTQAGIRTSLSPLYEAISNTSSPAVKFIRSRVERMSERWIQAGLKMRQSRNKTVSTQMRVCLYHSFFCTITVSTQYGTLLQVVTTFRQVLLYPGALAGNVGQHFEAMVERGGPLGELVQWADLSVCLTILGHNLTFSTSKHQLHRFMNLFTIFSLYTTQIMMFFFPIKIQNVFVLTGPV